MTKYIFECSKLQCITSQKLPATPDDFNHFGAIFRGPEFSRGQQYSVNMCSNWFQVITKFREKVMDGSKVICQKV